LVPEPLTLEPKSTILPSHIPLRENEDEPEFQFLDLDLILEPILTPGLLLNLSQIPESVLIPEPLTPEPKSTISPYPLNCRTKV